ncbi:MAG: hypothetical protein LBI43_03090 [Streptococcaceae bacterium]|nr:hypothetical protein [Streptococcaceae bacterium]
MENEPRFRRSRKQSSGMKIPVTREESEASLDDYDENYRFDPKKLHPRMEERSSTRGNAPFYLPFFVLSVLVSLTYYSFPLTHRLATGITAQNLYAGFAMNHGVTPYNDFSASAGPLFYLIARVGNLGGTTTILWLIELGALFLTGLFAYKALASAVSDNRLAAVCAGFTILATGILSLGGANPAMIALPFALYGVAQITRYLTDDEAKRDETFILYGMAGAAASLLSPIFLLLWVIAFFAFLTYNLREGLLGRGFYQFLASLFGFLIIYALVGYYTLTAQIFFPTITQAVVIPFTHLGLTGSSLPNFAIALGLLLLSGLLLSWLFGFRVMRAGEHAAWYGALVVFSLLVLVITALRRDFTPADALVILPFVFLFSGLRLSEEGREERLATASLVSNYLRGHLFLPLLGVLLLTASPMLINSLNKNYFASEHAVASYVAAHTSAKEQVLVAANDDNINLLSRRVSSLSLPPSYYPKTEQQIFDTQISNPSAKYIVIQKSKTIPKSLKTELKQSYKTVSFTNSEFSIYEKK